jgi:hypothetical protein
MIYLKFKNETFLKSELLNNTAQNMQSQKNKIQNGIVANAYRRSALLFFFCGGGSYVA